MSGGGASTGTKLTPANAGATFWADEMEADMVTKHAIRAIGSGRIHIALPDA
jgi:hypothetical protein